MPVGSQNLASFPGQINQTQQSYSVQDNLGKMLGRVLQWQPDAPSTEVRKWINDTYRSIIDMRSWAGLKIRGQVTVPNIYTAGTVALTLGSPNVVGTGTAWTNAMVGMQLRAGFSTGFYNILSVTGPTHLVLDLPWGNQTIAASGYTLMQVWVTLGPNIKSIKHMVNQRQGYRLRLQVPQSVLNGWDTWRTTTGWTWACSPKEMTSTGVPQFELYPAPTFQQAFPYLAYVQPPDLVNDADFPYPFIPSDVLVLPAQANALVFRGPKLNPYYDAREAERKMRQFNTRLEVMINADDALDPKDEQWNEVPLVGMPGGSQYRQNHDDGDW